jgi:hypothetical protein
MTFTTKPREAPFSTESHSGSELNSHLTARLAYVVMRSTGSASDAQKSSLGWGQDVDPFNHYEGRR